MFHTFAIFLSFLPAEGLVSINETGCHITFYILHVVALLHVFQFDRFFFPICIFLLLTYA